VKLQSSGVGASLWPRSPIEARSSLCPGETKIPCFRGCALTSLLESHCAWCEGWLFGPEKGREKVGECDSPAS